MGYIEYDYLVLAMGADTNYFGSETIEHFASPMKTVSKALYIRNKIISNYERAINIERMEDRKSLMNMVIVGGGPTGVELAGAMAELRNNVFPKDYPELSFKNMKVLLIEVGPALHDVQRVSGACFSLSQGAWSRSHNRHKVKDYNGKVVSLESSEIIETETLLWAAGIKSNKIAGFPDEKYAPNGRIIVDEFSEVPGMQDVFVLGDGSLLKEDRYPRGHPQVAQTALQQAENLAENLLRVQKGKPRKLFRYKDL